jgi:hypothetical protein
MVAIRACPWVSGRTVLAACVPVVLLLSGCAAASGTPGYDSRFGDAARALQAQQVLDADSARRHAGLMRGTDGRTMREAMDRQVGSFKEPPATNVISIGVGGGR